MASTYLSKGLKRSALTVALGLCFAGGVQAQSAVGSIFGEAPANSSVSIENLDTGATRQISADANGRFSFSQLQPGRYRVTSNGVTREVQVKVGTGTSVSLNQQATTLGTVTVIGSGAINPIDVSSVESTTVFTQQQIQQLPVARDITNVALLAPGTVKGDTGLGNGNLASFGGSSVAENGYYINGFDVTNIRNFLSYADLPFDAIGEQQVKTGGYGAEFGRSLGGVISLVTKRGTNEWKGGVSAYWVPSWGREAGKDVVSRNPLDQQSGDIYSVYRSANESESLTYNVYGGGPLVKDKLFFFGLIEGRSNSSDTYRRITSTHTSDTSPNALVKLDWNITDNHVLEFTGIHNKNKTHYRDYSYANGAKYVGQHQNLDAEYDVENGGDVYIGKYTGYLTDSFTLSAMAGRLENVNSYRTPESLPGGNCPRAYDSRTNPSSVTYIGCWNQSQTYIRDPNWGPDKDTRNAFRLDGEWILGNHHLRFGYDTEKFTSGHAGQVYTGGIYWRFYFVPANTTRVVNGVTVNGGANGQNYARSWYYQTTSGSYEVRNTAYYLEDSWQLTDKFLVYAGVRSEGFENKNSTGDTFVKADNQIAPRLGFSWDVNGDSTFKVFGNAGRYYIPVASNTNIRASGGEVLIQNFYYTTGVDAANGVPLGIGSKIGPESVNGSLNPPDPRTIAVTDLKPMYQDEFILGMQMQLNDAWTVGARAIHRQVKNGMDDYCSHQAFVNWANDNGYTNFDPSSMATCFIVNPGRDIKIALDLNSDGNYTVVTVPNSYLGLPKYQRSYNALELFWERNAGDNWFLQGSYTFAKSRGNVEGYVNSTLEQEDAGLTQDFDHRLFEDGAYGYLPNDRRHTLKLFGSYKINDEWRVGANLLVQSGRPVNCTGYVPLTGLGVDASSLNAYGPSSFYCLDQNGNKFLSQRGAFGRTPWTRNVDLQVSYQPNWADKKLTLAVDAFNVFNFQTVTEYDERSELDRSTPTYNPNFLNAANFQSPRYLRFTVRYQF
ncbi:TonB-dependent receptor [Thermomonas alba]|uniref:TonB-dependent receptor n=1 Tax=Thermomonas alba TaxID=2888525 RepID=UPI001F042710|nr:TonB-dependent receptor [Thermomonas alba]